MVNVSASRLLAATTDPILPLVYSTASFYASKVHSAVSAAQLMTPTLSLVL